MNSGSFPGARPSGDQLSERAPIQRGLTMPISVGVLTPKVSRYRRQRSDMCGVMSSSIGRLCASQSMCGVADAARGRGTAPTVSVTFNAPTTIAAMRPYHKVKSFGIGMDTNRNTSGIAAARTRSLGSSDGLLDPSEIVLPAEIFEAFPQSDLSQRMTEMRLSPATSSALGRAGRALAGAYYPEFLALFDPTVLDPGRWVAARARLDPQTARVVSLLLLCERVRRPELPEEVAELVDALEDAGLCDCDPAEDTVWLPGLCLNRFRDVWILAQ